MLENTPLITAVITNIVLLVGYLLSRRGSREANKQQQAAAILAEREADWKHRGEVIQDLRQAVEDRDKTIATKDQRIEHLLTVCSTSSLASIETIAMLKQVVQSETAKEMADMGVLAIKRHEQEDH